jgi:hypothetical protein
VDPSSPFRQPPFGSPPVFGSDPPPSFGGSNRGQRQQGGGGELPGPFGGGDEWPGPFSGNNRGRRQQGGGGPPLLAVPIVWPGGGPPIVPQFQNNPKQPILPIFAQKKGKPIVPPFVQWQVPIGPLIGPNGQPILPITSDWPVPPGQIVYDLPVSMLDSVYCGESVWVGGNAIIAGVISGALATTLYPGTVQPDGTTITIDGGVISLAAVPATVLAAVLATISGYDGAVQQILGHDASGNLAWVSVTSC